MPPPIIYNLFPRLAGTLDQWAEHARRARRLGFNWIFLNPVSQPGFSGSLYAVRDHGRVASDFLGPNSSPDGQAELKQVLGEFSALGLRPMMDLVINHTAIDCPLVHTHPDWFCRDEEGQVLHPSAIDPADARKVTVWGDLAEVDNADSPDLDALWDFWKALVRKSVELGFKGFRCDAAYKVPAVLWRVLVDEARELDPEVVFFAETLGCRLEEVSALKPAGLDYLFNSSKYWNFDAAWALEQHAQFGAIAPSISFPESHDTPRLMDETDGNLAVQRQRYMLAAVYSAGLLMPMGYEFGHSQRLNVVETRPEHWEQTGIDLCAYVQSVNRLKIELGALGNEGRLEALSPCDRPTLLLSKQVGEHLALIGVNKDWHQPQWLDLSGLERQTAAELIRVCPDGEIRRESVPDGMALEPAEIVIVA
jgi:starch synthase (maltosyl-transferring)